MNKYILLSAGAVVACVVAAPASAQVGPPAAPDAGVPLQQTTAPSSSAGTAAEQSAPSPAADVLQDIIVTAQRRTENLQNVAVSATALSAEGLTEKSVTRLSDLQFAAPSLSVSDNGLTQQANIRGIGLASGSPSVANGVATYLDGLFQPPIVATGAFYDIASVEVFRGPQGTLVGSNSTGGAIFINTQNPKFDKVGGYAEATYGNYNTAALQGALNVPVSDTLAVRAAGQYRRHDSYYTDIGPFDGHPGSLDEKAARLSVLWRPGDFQLLVKSDFLVHDLGGFADRPILGSPYQAGRTDDIRLVDYSTPQRQHERAWINGAEARYTFGGGYTLRVIGGWQDKHSNLLYDNDATAGPVYGANGALLDQISTNQFVRERQGSGEVNLISPTSGPFNWILGGYYQSNKIDVRLAQSAATPLNVDQVQVKHTTGVFAQGNYHLTDKLELQVGARYSHFEATGRGAVFIGRGSPGFPPGGIQVADLAGGNKDGRVTGKVALNYKLDSDNLIYAFAARGYKPGGYNSATSFFAPETVWNYELGWKSTLAGGHLRTQIDAFYNDYHGFQFGVIDVTSGQAGVTNLPTATIKGLEGQLQAKFGGFSADVSASFVDSKLPAFRTVNSRLLPPGNLGPQCAPGQAAGPTCFNYAPYLATAGGGSNLLSPRFTWTAGVQYSIATGNGATLTPRLNYAYVGSQYAGLFYSPTLDLLGSRGLLSALVTYRHDNWRIEGFANNLADRRYVSGQIGNNEVYGSPREYGLRVGIDF